jgi:hypothetical protein
MIDIYAWGFLQRLDVIHCSSAVVRRRARPVNLVRASWSMQCKSMHSTLGYIKWNHPKNRPPVDPHGAARGTLVTASGAPLSLAPFATAAAGCRRRWWRAPSPPKLSGRDLAVETWAGTHGVGIDCEGCDGWRRRVHAVQLHRGVPGRRPYGKVVVTRYRLVNAYKL